MQVHAPSRNRKSSQTMHIIMPATFIRTITVIAQPTVNGRLPRRHSHNGDLLAPRLHVKVATTKQRRDDRAAAEADLRQGRVFGVFSGGRNFLQSIRFVCIRLPEIDVGDAAVRFTPAQLDDMDGGVTKTEGGIEFFPSKT